MSIKLKESKEINEITVNNMEILITQLADDTTLVLKNTKSLDETLVV